MSYAEFIERLRPNDILNSLLYTDYENTGTYHYVGLVSPAGAWCIVQVEISTKQALYCFGSTEYSTAWLDRYVLTYTTPDQS